MWQVRRVGHNAELLSYALTGPTNRSLHMLLGFKGVSFRVLNFRVLIVSPGVASVCDIGRAACATPCCLDLRALVVLSSRGMCMEHMEVSTLPKLRKYQIMQPHTRMFAFAHAL